MTYNVYGFAEVEKYQVIFIEIYEFDETKRNDWISFKDYLDDALAKGMQYWDLYKMHNVKFITTKDKEYAEMVRDQLAHIIHPKNENIDDVI